MGRCRKEGHQRGGGEEEGRENTVCIFFFQETVLTYLTVPKPRLTMIRSIQASARFTAETNSATRIKPFAVVEGEMGGEGRGGEGRGGEGRGGEGRGGEGRGGEGRGGEEERKGGRKGGGRGRGERGGREKGKEEWIRGREEGREREKSVIAIAHSYEANLRSSPKLTELYSDTKNVFSRNPRMITAPIQNYQWKEGKQVRRGEEEEEGGGGGRRGGGRRGEEGGRRGGGDRNRDKRRQRMGWRETERGEKESYKRALRSGV